MNIKISVKDALEIDDVVENVWIQFDTHSLDIRLENGCSVSFSGEKIFNEAYRALFYPTSGYVKLHTKCVDGHIGTIRARVHPFEIKCPECSLDAEITSAKVFD